MPVLINPEEIDRIREAMEERGYPPEYVAAAIELYNLLPGIVVVVWDELSSLWDALLPIFENVINEIQRLAALGDGIQTSMELLADMAEPVPESPAPVPPHKRKKTRPPRYIGPARNTPPRAQRPPRVARSSCRKIRR